MGRILILFGICSFIFTLISNYFDVVLQIEGKNEITQLGQCWFHFAPNSLQIAETIVSRYIDPCSALDILDCSGFIWHPFISSILLMPAAIILAILSFIFIALGLKKGRKSIFYKGLNLLEKYNFNYSDSVVSLTNSAKIYLQQKYIFKKQKIVVIPTCVDTSRFKYSFKKSYRHL